MPATLKRTPPEKATARDQSGTNHPGWVFARNAVLWALFLFVAVNFTLSMVAGEKQSLYKDVWRGAGSIDLAMDRFKLQKEKHRVILLGSSLVMFPFYGMDLELGKTSGDIFHHHHSHTLDLELKKAGYSNPSSYSLALYGQMVSDAYILVNEFLQGEQAPDWLVFGIAPRDFIDNDLAAPTATTTFKRLVDLSNFDHYASLYLPQWQDKAEFVLSHVCYLYGRRWRLQHDIDNLLDRIYKAFGITPGEQRAKSEDAQGGFMMYANRDLAWAHSKKEYRRRYRHIRERDLSVQMSFLDRLLRICQERKIKVVVVNMPLTSTNRSLLPAGFYDRFRGEVQATVNRHQGRLLDYGDSNEFDDTDFCDTAHLNHLGGHKLVKHLVRTMIVK